MKIEKSIDFIFPYNVIYDIIHMIIARFFENEKALYKIKEGYI